MAKSQVKETTATLPAHWRTDQTLKETIPPPHDWRSFARYPANPDRYAICINGSGVFDILAKRFLSPIIDPRNNRKRYRLTGDDAAGKRASTKKVYYARLIATLVHGNPKKGHEAHHRDHDRTNDRWANVVWETSSANKAMAARQADRRGERNPKSKLTHKKLRDFIWSYDDDIDDQRKPDLQRYSEIYKVSQHQLRLIASGKSRVQETAEIRNAITDMRRDVSARYKETMREYAAEKAARIASKKK